MLEFLASDFIPVMEEALKHKRGIIFAKGEGIYFTAFKPNLADDKQATGLMAYAKGCNPNTDANWAETCDALGGGSGERFTIIGTEDPMLQLIYERKLDFDVFVTDHMCLISPK